MGNRPNQNRPNRPNRPNQNQPNRPGPWAGNQPGMRPPGKPKPPAAPKPPTFQAPSITSNEGYQATLQANQNRYNTTTAGLDNQERQLGVNYGMGQYGGDIASNPYSRAALLQRSYDQNQKRSLNSMAAAGQLYSGSTTNAYNLNRFNRDQASDALAKDFQARIDRIGFERRAAQDQLATENAQALRESVSDMPDLYPSTPENTSDEMFGGGGGNRPGGNRPNRPGNNRPNRPNQNRPNRPNQNRPQGNRPNQQRPQQQNRPQQNKPPPKKGKK